MASNRIVGTKIKIQTGESFTVVLPDGTEVEIRMGKIALRCRCEKTKVEKVVNKKTEKTAKYLARSIQEAYFHMED